MKKLTKKKKILIAVCIPLLIAVILANLILTDVILVGKSSKDGSLWIGKSNYAKQGIMYICGEVHSQDALLAEELRLWQDLYHNEGMRHFFVEYGYFTAEWLNLWMQSDNNDILWQIHNDWEGTLAHNMNVYNFYLSLKTSCPDTIFHGTDIGHQYKTTGARYIKYLEDNGLTDTENYTLALEAIEQGKKYYGEGEGKDHAYREQMMFENFKREYEKLDGLSIFGVYGGAHVQYPAYREGLENVPTMVTMISREIGQTNLVTDMLSWRIKY